MLVLSARVGSFILIVTSLFIGNFAYKSAAAEPANDRMRAVAAIRRLGGRAEADTKKAGSTIVGVILTRTKADDADLAVIVKGLPELRCLDLEATNVKDAGLACLIGLAELKSLSLINTDVTDAGLARLKGLVQLQRLDLSATKITDAGLAKLSTLTNLRQLGLGLTKISDRGLLQLKTLTQLRKLDLFLTKVTDAGVESLRKSMPLVEVSR